MIVAQVEKRSAIERIHGLVTLVAVLSAISLLEAPVHASSSALISAAAELSHASLVQVRFRGVNPRMADQARKAEIEKAQQKAKEKALDQALQPAGPLKPLLRWLLTPNGVPGAPPEQSVPQKETGKDRDFMDGRAPHDLKIEQVMRAAEKSAGKKDWKSAVEFLQKILDQPEDTLYRLSDGRWQSVRRTANELLGSAPKEVLQDYRTQYSGLAQQMLADARRTGRTADYVNVANRFQHTPAGFEAVNYLGSMHFDRGEFGLAAAWFDQIARSTLSSDGAWRVKAALAYRKAGNLSASKELLAGLDQATANRVNLGTGAVEPETWIGGKTTEMPGRSAILKEWTQIYGTAARRGTAIGGEPLLAPLWNIPLTSSHTVKRRLNWLLQDLTDQQKTPVLAAMPLVVGGKVVYRDLRGVRAVDIETGKTIWESMEGVSAERILGGLSNQQVESREAWRFRINQFQVENQEYQGQSVEYHPLASLLFRDGIYGLISSDGQQVFVLEDHGILSRHQPGQHWGFDGSNESQDPYGVPWKTNRLVSYDLKTGRPRWSIGGGESKESFDLPLAGSFFYGTPAIDGDELLIVAGKGDDVRLWGLDRATGTPRWSQLIAYTDTKIEQDIGRRWFCAQVASDGGVIVCPTTVGWLVGVDRMRQSVLWAHRYIPPSGSHERDPNSQFVPQRDLSLQWSPSAPVISGSTVVYTPPEESIVLALNLLDGRRLWEMPKETWMYLAGVFDERVVMVGQTEVAALELATGKVLWKSSLDGSQPSGRGQGVEDQYYLPLSNGELRVIDLKTGKTISSGYVPSTHPPLGNLAMHQGKLVALGANGLVGFGQREAVLAEIQRRKAANATDSWALLREAEIQLLNRQHAVALPLLQAIDPAGLTADEQSRRHGELLECLANVIRQDPKSHATELEELGRLAKTPSERRLHQELTADHLAVSGKPLEAFDILWSLGKSFDGETTIVRSDDPQVQLSPRVWLSARLHDLWSSAEGANREQVDSRVAALVADAKGANASVRGSIVALLGFHPFAVSLKEAVIDDLATAGDFSGAELELLKLTSGADRLVSARAILRLARLMEQFNLPADAGYYYRSLESEFGDVVVADGVTGAELVKRLRTESKVADAKRVRVSAWDERPLQLIQGPIQYMPPSHESVLRSPLPYFDPLTVEFHQQEQRLAFGYIDNGTYAWLAPLRSSPRNQGEAYISSEFLGHQVVLVNRDVLHVLSPVEKRMMWAKALDGAGEGGPFWRHASRPPLIAMTDATQDRDQSPVLLQAGVTGRLAAVQPGYVCVYGRRSISVVDPRTGEWLWRKDGIPQFAQVLGNRDMICVIPQDRSKSEAFRVSDGKQLKIEKLGTMLGNALQMSGDSLLLLEGSGAKVGFLNLGGGRSRLRLHQPLAQTDRWKADLPSGALVTAIDQHQLLVVPPDGKVERIEIATGKRIAMAPIPVADTKLRRTDTFALADDDNIYLISNVMETAGFHHYGESLPSIRANGVIHAWKRSDGSLAWRQEVKHQNLVVDRFRSMPILLFVARSWKQKGNISYGTLSIQAIHKQTGKVLHDSTVASMYSGFHSLDVNLSELSIELKSYNLRMRLVPTNGPVAEVKPVKPAEDEKKN